MLMDYGESFYYYALGQKRETWNRSVGWYAFAGDTVTFRKLTINGSSRPVLVKLEDPVSTKLEPEEEIRDVEFYRFISKTLGKELFSSVQITGEGFDQQWAQQSVKLLCHQGRKVFYGNNLFAKGACIAGKDRLEDKKTQRLPLFKRFAGGCGRRNGYAGDGLSGLLSADRKRQQLV